MMRRKHVIGPDGRRLTLADLPSPGTKRWVIRRKAEVVAAVRGGLLSLEQACSRYALNFEEFRSWERCIDRFGVKGLRTTRIQFYLNFGSSTAGEQKRTPTKGARGLLKTLPTSDRVTLQHLMNTDRVRMHPRASAHETKIGSRRRIRK
jgi:hypothetical protein